MHFKKFYVKIKFTFNTSISFFFFITNTIYLKYYQTKITKSSYFCFASNLLWKLLLAENILLR